MNLRTDLAIEARGLHPNDMPGVTSEEKMLDERHQYTKIAITDKEASEELKKPIGKYFTIDTDDLSKKTVSELHTTASHVATAIKEMLADTKFQSVLIIGLGNKDITPDALGPKVCDKVFVTNHLFSLLPDLEKEGYSKVFSIAPGVLGTTGMLTEEVAKALCEHEKPDVVIAVDALASRKTDRICASLQISDTGILPGSGLGNKTKGLTEEYLGVKVISIGVPMVTYASVVAIDLLELVFGGNMSEEEGGKLFSAISSRKEAELIVTPKNVDVMLVSASQTIAMAINMAVHRNFDPQLAAEFSGV